MNWEGSGRQRSELNEMFYLEGLNDKPSFRIRGVPTGN
jgi:hypothetical protein